MVNSCSAFNCTARYIKGGNLKFHCFPKDAALREKWIRAVRRKDFEPGSRAVLCSKHFEDSDYVQTVMDTKRLKKDAVPSIFDFPAPFNIKRKQRKMSKECHSPIEDSTPQPSTLCGNPPILTEQAKVDEAVPVRINKRRRRDPVLFGDFIEEDLECPIKRKRYWQVSQKVIKQKNASYEIIRQKNRRLINRLKKLNVDVKSKNKLTSKNSGILKERIPDAEKQLQFKWFKFENIS